MGCSRSPGGWADTDGHGFVLRESGPLTTRMRLRDALVLARRGEQQLSGARSLHTAAYLAYLDRKRRHAQAIDDLVVELLWLRPRTTAEVAGKLGVCHTAAHHRLHRLGAEGRVGVFGRTGQSGTAYLWGPIRGGGR